MYRLSEPSGLLQPGTERTILQPQKCIVIISYIYVLEMRLHDLSVLTSYSYNNGRYGIVCNSLESRTL